MSTAHKKALFHWNFSSNSSGFLFRYKKRERTRKQRNTTKQRRGRWKEGRSDANWRENRRTSQRERVCGKERDKETNRNSREVTVIFCFRLQRTHTHIHTRLSPTTCLWASTPGSKVGRTPGGKPEPKHTTVCVCETQTFSSTYRSVSIHLFYISIYMYIYIQKCIESNVHHIPVYWVKLYYDLWTLWVKVQLKLNCVFDKKISINILHVCSGVCDYLIKDYL